jgi:hypothetical protein
VLDVMAEIWRNWDRADDVLPPGGACEEEHHYGRDHMTGKIIRLALGLGAAGLMAGGLASATPASAHTTPHARPHAAHSVWADDQSYPVTAQSVEFATGTGSFCEGASAPCDGGPGDYGTIDRVHSRYSNGGAGNYAPFTTALTGHWMAVADGTGDVNQGGGCPSSATEACTGPYMLPGSGAARGNENVFPTHGYTVTDDVYLDPATMTGANSQIDSDWAINQSGSGGFGQDEVVSACSVAGGIALSFGNSSPGACGNSASITTAGWYRFVTQFQNTGGDAYADASVYTDPGLTQVFNSGPQPVGGSPSSVSNWGGPAYFWLPTEDQDGLPLANVAVQVGQDAQGHTP